MNGPDVVEVILLGVAQDAGVPQAGALKGRSLLAWDDARLQVHSVSLGVVHRASKSAWMIDATPDFKWQWHRLYRFAPECALRGIFISHAHIGHYTGLIHIGKEAANTQGMPVIGTPRLCEFLRSNGPWSQLVGNANIHLQELGPNETFVHTVDGVPVLQLTTLPVPHRDEFSDTMAYSLRGPSRSLFFCPDIDKWERWERDVRDVVLEHDVSLIDGSFFDGAELGGRDMSQVLHPTIGDSLARLSGVQRDVRFVHMNHTNPLLDDESPQSKVVRAAGFSAGQTGNVIVL